MYIPRNSNSMSVQFAPTHTYKLQERHSKRITNELSNSLSLNHVRVRISSNAYAHQHKVRMSLKQLVGNFPTRDFFPALPSTFTTLLLTISSTTNWFKSPTASVQYRCKPPPQDKTRHDTTRPRKMDALGSHM